MEPPIYVPVPARVTLEAGPLALLKQLEFEVQRSELQGWHCVLELVGGPVELLSAAELAETVSAALRLCRKKHPELHADGLASYRRASAVWSACR